MSTRGLVRNVAINITGQVAPLLVAAFAIPKLIQELGVERFGILTLIWVVVGYFSIFDFGLGRALTKAVAECLGKDRPDKIPQLLVNGLILMLALGTVGGITLFAVYEAASTQSDWVAARASELDRIVLWVAMSIPAVVVATGLRGVLEAYQRFGAINLVRLPLGVWTYLGPLLVVSYRNDLFLVVLALLFGRLLTTLLFIPFVWTTQNWRGANTALSKAVCVDLFRFGGWLTISNVVSPLMTYLDRFVVGAVLGAGVVAYYTTPYEVISKLVIVPEAIFAVIFPRMARKIASESSVNNSYRLLNALVGSVMGAVAIVCVGVAHEFFGAWISDGFADRAAPIFKVLAAGLFVNTLSRIPYNLVQAAGNSKATAILHLAELPIYLSFLLGLLHVYGLIGAAIAWLIRMLLDNVLLGYVARRNKLISGMEYGRACSLMAGMLGLLMTGMVLDGAEWRAVWAVIAFAACATFAWFCVLVSEDRAALRALLRSCRR